MRILFISDITSIHAIRWVRYLVVVGHDVTVLSVRAGKVKGARVIYQDPGDLPAPKCFRIFRHLLFICRLWWLVRMVRFDIVHVHFLRADMIGVIATLHPRSIITVWGSDVRPISEGGDPRRLPLKKKALEQAKLITAPTHFLEDRVRLLTANIKRVEIVPFGVDTDIFRKKDKPKSKTGETRFCYAKLKLASFYGPDIAIKAMEKVIKHCPGAKLALLGNGDSEDFEKLRKLVISLKLQNHIKFFGVVNSSDVARFLELNDVLLQPSRWESFGVVVLEAAAIGLPTIASCVGGITDIVIDDITGLTFPSEDVNALAEAMIRLALDPKLREQLGENAYELVGKLYNFKMHAERMEEFYREVISGNRE